MLPEENDWAGERRAFSTDYIFIAQEKTRGSEKPDNVGESMSLQNSVTTISNKTPWK